MLIHFDIGGEGRYAGAINVNPQALTSTTGTPGRPIPSLVVARGERLPFADAIADLVTVENAPLRPGAADEIARVLKPGGTVRLLHPTPYAIGSAAHDAVAGALGTSLASRGAWSLGDSTLTIMRRAVQLLR
jgi:SAM-dependent methyltransferase